MNFADIFSDSRLTFSTEFGHWSCDPDDNPLHFQVSSFNPVHFFPLMSLCFNPYRVLGVEKRRSFHK